MPVNNGQVFGESGVTEVVFSVARRDGCMIVVVVESCSRSSNNRSSELS